MLSHTPCLWQVFYEIFPVFLFKKAARSFLSSPDCFRQNTLYIFTYIVHLFLLLFYPEHPGRRQDSHSLQLILIAVAGPLRSPCIRACPGVLLVTDMDGSEGIITVAVGRQRNAVPAFFQICQG